MLYVTTGEKYDAYTVARVLASDCGPDGGRYLPFKMPRFTAGEVRGLKDKTFGQCVADVLNLFFCAGLSGWDVEFCIGRYPVKPASMGQKILVAECWRNLDGSYAKMERQLAARVCGCFPAEVKLTSWLRIAIRIAVLTGVFGELQRMGISDAVDVAVPEGDFTVPMAVWYTRQMGLPIANIICGCADGSNAWDLIHTGQLRTAGGVEPELERLVHGTLGVDEALRYRYICEGGEVYSLLPHMLSTLRSGLYAAVVSRERLAAVVPNVYRTNAYLLEPGAAISYSALLDYRAKNGESRCAMLIADEDPTDSEQKLKELLH